jgi:hypothetical protein
MSHIKEKPFLNNALMAHAGRILNSAMAFNLTIVLF